MRRALSIAGVVLAIALVAVAAFSLLGTTPSTPTPPQEDVDDERERVVRFADHESGIYPWLSSRPEFRQRSPINVVVLGDADRVVRILQASGQTEWVEPPEDAEEVRETDHSMRELPVNGTAVGWDRTGGGARYAYVERRPGDGEWVRETAHLQDGDYYGHRVHLRLYESPREDEQWVAIQAHTEHFDWFTLRHAVDGLQEAQVHVERDLRAHPEVDREDVVRRDLGNAGVADSDGWATVVTLSLLVPLLGLGAPSLGRFWRDHLTPGDRRRLRGIRERITPAYWRLAASIVVLVLGVRFAGVVLERGVEALTMHQIAALLYPLIAVGVPVATYVIAGGIERRMDAAVTAAVSLAAAVLLDYVAVGVGVVPIDILVHRVGVILALGLVAGGAAQRARRETRLNELAVTGALLWVLLLSAALFELV